MTPPKRAPTTREIDPDASRIGHPLNLNRHRVLTAWRRVQSFSDLIAAMVQQQPDTRQMPEVPDTEGDATVKQAAVPPSYTGAPIPSERSHPAASPDTSPQGELPREGPTLSRQDLQQFFGVGPVMSKPEASSTPRLEEPAHITTKRKARNQSPDRLSLASQSSPCSPTSDSRPEDAPPSTPRRPRRTGKQPCIEFEPSCEAHSDSIEADSPAGTRPSSPGSSLGEDFSYDIPDSPPGRDEVAPQTRREIEAILANMAASAASVNSTTIEADNNVDEHGRVSGGLADVPEDEGFCDGTSDFPMNPNIQLELMINRQLNRGRGGQRLVRKETRMRRRPAVKVAPPSEPVQSSKPSSSTSTSS